MSYATIMKTIFIELLIACIVAASSSSSSSYHVEVENIKACNCGCPDVFTKERSVCEILDYLKVVVMKLTEQLGELRDLKDRIEEQEDLTKILKDDVEDLKKPKVAIESVPTPEALIMTTSENMMGDSSRETRMKDDGDLAKNVSSLLAKVEVVENLTSKVQEELKSERRVRRHLEEDLNETRSSIRLLDDKLQNVTFPMERRDDLVEEVMLSTLKNINKTLFEEHLRKLYYRLDGVVYRNETKELYDHLDEVDASSDKSIGQISQLGEELRSLSGIVASLNDNITEELVLKETRLNALEERTSEIELLDDQVSLLMNASELIHGGIAEIWGDLQDMRIYTDETKKELQEQIVERDNFTEAMKLDISEKFENLTSELSATRAEVSEVKKPIESLKYELTALATDLVLAENRIEGMGTYTDTRLEDITLKVTMVTDLWNTSIATIAEQMARLNKNRMEKLVQDSPCALPEVTDPNLLMLLRNDPSGHTTLEFGCRPIGRYFLDSNSSAVTCVGGMWQGPIPSCTRLLNEEEMDSIAAEFRDVNPCQYSFGDIPDPVDCAHYFYCAPDGTSRRKRCPPDYAFNPESQICEPAHYRRCQPDFSSHDKLNDIIPTIHIDPDNVDEAYSMKGTGPRGELVVYPRTSFTLHCMFPDTVWGLPTWRFSPSYLISGGQYGAVGLATNHVPMRSTRQGPNRVSISVQVATESSSGVYMCVSPRGKFNWITVVVKDLQCPPITLNGAGSRNAYYRPHPDGQYRILTTTVEFQCKGGFSIKAMCQGDGTWSRPAPSAEECPQEGGLGPTSTDLGRTDTLPSGCPPIDTNGHPNLMLDADDEDSTIITFRCAAGTRLIGNAFTRCYDGSWTYFSLPTCVPMNGFV